MPKAGVLLDMDDLLGLGTKPATTSVNTNAGFGFEEP
jgi:hypothetical protein